MQWKDLICFLTSTGGNCSFQRRAYNNWTPTSVADADSHAALSFFSLLIEMIGQLHYFLSLQYIYNAAVVEYRCILRPFPLYGRTVFIEGIIQPRYFPHTAHPNCHELFQYKPSSSSSSSSSRCTIYTTTSEQSMRCIVDQFIARIV